MASTTTYGDFPGVKVTTAGGAITGVAIGREQKLVLVGVGDQSNGDASVNEATQIASRLDADRKFGDGSELAEQMKDALANGANIDFLYGVMADVQDEGPENKTSTSFTLDNAPIIEDASTITVTDSGSTELGVEFRYDSPPTNDGSDGTAYINPITGEVEVESTDSDFDVEYDYPDVESARAEAETVLGDEETGIIAQLFEQEDEATNLSGSVNTLRGEYKLAMGVQAAQPNGNQSDGGAYYDTGAYSDSIDNDALFLHAPARKDESKVTVTGALSGYMAGASLGPGGSIYGDNLTVDDLDQKISKSEAQDFRDAQVLPIRQPPQGGSIEIADNLSTSTEEDWVRDYWRRRIVDQAILIAKTVGDSIIGRINDERTRETVQSDLKGLNEDRLITDNYFVDVYEVDTDTVGIDLGITPYGIVKRVDVSITINT
jgi:hypothetical protein